MYLFRQAVGVTPPTLSKLASFLPPLFASGFAPAILSTLTLVQIV